MTGKFVRSVTLGALAATLVALPSAHAAKLDWEQAEPEVLIEGLEMPVDIDVAPDGSVWFITLEGNVSRLDPQTKTVEAKHHVPNVQTGGERGLVGFALAHDFEDTGAFYLYYTQRTEDPNGGLNRLVRVVGGQETLLTTVPGAKEHNGGRIVVDEDGNLFVSTGENQLREPAQDPASPLGKILRLTPQGGAVEGNLAGIVYSKGHRNPYGLAIDPDSGELWSTENSGWRRDEVNIIEAGANYGYPECEGLGLNGVDTPCPTTKGYTFPLLTFYENDAVAPTGCAFWRGGFYWASLNEGSIHHLFKGADGKWKDEKVLVHGMPILDLDVGSDDLLYLSTVDGILRIDLPGGEGGSGAGIDDVDDVDDVGYAGEEGVPAPPLLLAAVAVALAAALRRRA